MPLFFRIAGTVVIFGLLMMGCKPRGESNLKDATATPCPTDDHEAFRVCIDEMVAGLNHHVAALQSLAAAEAGVTAGATDPKSFSLLDETQGRVDSSVELMKEQLLSLRKAVNLLVGELEEKVGEEQQTLKLQIAAMQAQISLFETTINLQGKQIASDGQKLNETIKQLNQVQQLLVLLTQEVNKLKQGQAQGAVGATPMPSKKQQGQGGQEHGEKLVNRQLLCIRTSNRFYPTEPSSSTTYGYGMDEASCNRAVAAQTHGIICTFYQGSYSSGFQPTRLADKRPIGNLQNLDQCLNRLKEIHGDFLCSWYQGQYSSGYYPHNIRSLDIYGTVDSEAECLSNIKGQNAGMLCTRYQSQYSNGYYPTVINGNEKIGSLTDPRKCREQVQLSRNGYICKYHQSQYSSGFYLYNMDSKKTLGDISSWDECKRNLGKI